MKIMECYNISGLEEGKEFRITEFKMLYAINCIKEKKMNLKNYLFGSIVSKNVLRYMDYLMIVCIAVDLFDGWIFKLKMLMFYN